MNTPNATWRKASYSNGQGSCVEVGNCMRAVVVRDTKQDYMSDMERTSVPFTQEAWARFTRSLKK